MGDRLRVDVDGGKYTVVMTEDGRLSALRHGEPWRDCVGDKLILAMAHEIEELRGMAAGTPVLDDVVLIGVRADLAPVCWAAPDLLAACEEAESEARNQLVRLKLCGRMDGPEYQLWAAKQEKWAAAINKARI